MHVAANFCLPQTARILAAHVILTATPVLSKDANELTPPAQASLIRTAQSAAHIGADLFRPALPNVGRTIDFAVSPDGTDGRQRCRSDLTVSGMPLLRAFAAAQPKATSTTRQSIGCLVGGKPRDCLSA